MKPRQGYAMLGKRTDCKLSMSIRHSKVQSSKMRRVDRAVTVLLPAMKGIVIRSVYNCRIIEGPSVRSDWRSSKTLVPICCWAAETACSLCRLLQFALIIGPFTHTSLVL